MEDMKGDMGGRRLRDRPDDALAKRKAKVNAIGAIGLVENMPDGNAQRPGDVVTSSRARPLRYSTPMPKGVWCWLMCSGMCSSASSRSS